MVQHMEEPWKHYAKQKKPDKKGHILYPSICDIQDVKICRDRKQISSFAGCFSDFSLEWLKSSGAK